MTVDAAFSSFRGEDLFAGPIRTAEASRQSGLSANLLAWDDELVADVTRVGHREELGDTTRQD